jgi:hypothetical protein
MVSEIDHESGVLTLAADTTVAELPFDSGVLAGIKEGDLVTAHLAVSKVDIEPSWRAYDSPDPGDGFPPAIAPDETLIGRLQVSGTVESIDCASGRLAVRAEPRLLRIEFPPSAIRHLRDGDQVTVWTKFTRGADAEGAGDHL